MLKINRAKATIKTNDCNFGFDYIFDSGLNLVSSSINTRGKSSVIVAIYYCLGFEEIIGGRGAKTLTSVYKNMVIDEAGVSHNVLESEVWIEIFNGSTTVTLYRSGKMEGRDENLISVHYCGMNKIHEVDIYAEDMYVHAANSTTSAKGFHAFLENFIGFELPIVPATDGNEYKLYMQLIFSTMFIEQKRGWADLFSAMPIFSIKDAKKRVIEYILSLDTLSNEKKRIRIRLQETRIQSKWEAIITELHSLCNQEDCSISRLPMKPSILEAGFENAVIITTIERPVSTLDGKLRLLEAEKLQLTGVTPKIVDNYEDLNQELSVTEEYIKNFEVELETGRSKIVMEKATVQKLDGILEVINSDLRNNKDALKLKQMGSTMGIKSYQGVCPLCQSLIQDSLLPSQNCDHVMSIETNIKHLESQKAMISFAIGSHKDNLKKTDEYTQSLSGRIFTLRRLAKTLRNDLNAIDDNYSEAIVYKRIQIENRIQSLSNLKVMVNNKLRALLELSSEWKTLLHEKSELPKANVSESDRDKVAQLNTNFKRYLRMFNYSSAADYNAIQISQDNYLPVSEGFDMKFGSSASDNIRAIWAYTIALLHTSIEVGGNHPGILIFDEPAQHSIVANDVVSLLNAVMGMPGNIQVVLGITLADANLKHAVNELSGSKINIIDVGNHAFNKQ